VTFEYQWSKRFGTMKIEFIYFFDSSKIIDIIKAGRKDCRKRYPSTSYTEYFLIL
jgi:hypothetical protein